MTDETGKIKRIVLVGYPGSGKTMLAIGLSKSQRKGARILIPDSKARKRLADFIASTVGKEDNKAWPARTVFVDDNEAEKTDRKNCPLEIIWRDQEFGLEFEDYAGERASDPQNLKAFIDSIVGKNPYGAILLLNPGMPLFKPQKDIKENDVVRVLSDRESMPNVYAAIVDALCDNGCQCFVLAVTASDRISKGGDLFKTEQYENFKVTFEKIRDDLKKKLSIKNKECKKGKKFEYRVVKVSVTGRLMYKDGEAQKVHLAKDSENTAADPFLWIIDPWRRRFRNLVKRLMWIVPSSLLLLASMYVGAHAWNGYKIKNCLDQAESALANFGDPEAVNFDNEKGPSLMAGAESCLRDVNEREWFVADNDMATIDKRLPKLLAMLMTNQVWLAYKNAKVDGSDYNDHPHTTLCGKTELESWPYWARSIRCKASYEAAVVFCDQKASELSTKVITSNAKYLIGKFGKLNDYGKGKDRDIQFLFEKTHSCSNDMVRAACKTNLVNLIRLRDICLNKWEKDVSAGIPNNGAEEAKQRISLVITENTGLDSALVQNRIFAAHRDVELRDLKSKAITCEREVLDGGKDLQAVASELFRYLNEAAESPYKWIVLDAARKRFNEAVSTMLSSENNRKELFDQMFHATRKLRNLDEKVFNEECLGDNVLYWLAATITNENGKVYQYSTDWLRYDFQCEIAVRTDHATNNPGAPIFKRKVDANMTLSLGNDKKKIGGNWLILNNSGEANWTVIPDSKISATMDANDVLRIDVGRGEEDWKWDVNIPAFFCLFSPGWNDLEQYYAYKSKTDIYPCNALYRVRLHNAQIANGPYDTFSKALKMAKEREDELKAKRDEKVKDADVELERCAKEKGARK